ncbi:MAG: T9SS type A sorting domain-containing protein [Taibaiella sp.]|nr:T9SS type A sorting domain-containing protein [Taibaiella sp.]
MKKLFTMAALTFAAAASIAQTTATNWTASDCNGLSHTLFNELDSGKVIVFAWVMPCTSCVGPSKAAYDAVQSFATSNPGKVRFYLADDLGDATCTSLTNWVTTNSIGSTANMKIFGNAGKVIDEDDFGGTGMPHIIVMGGATHTIHFNKKNSSSNDPSGITAAINAAIGSTSVAGVESRVTFSISPNPVTNTLKVTSAEPVSSIQVMRLDGALVKEYNFPAGALNPMSDCSSLPVGTYMVRVTGKKGATAIQKFTKL